MSSVTTDVRMPKRRHQAEAAQARVSRISSSQRMPRTPAVTTAGERLNASEGSRRSGDPDRLTHQPLRGKEDPEAGVVAEQDDHGRHPGQPPCRSARAAGGRTGPCR